MPLTRRAALAALVLGVSGCAASPVISGTPALAPSPPPPSQAPEASAAQVAVAALRGSVEALSNAPGFAAGSWATAALAQCDAQLAVLALPDPFGPEDQEPFAVESPTPAPPASVEAGVAAVAEQVAAAVKALGAAATSAPEGDVRLMYASAAAGATALANRSLEPVIDGPAPVRLQPATLEASLPIALGHAWALIYGLGVGLGRLGSKDPLHALGSARLAIVKGLRNDLRGAITGEVPDEPAAFTLPNEMSTPDEIRSGWAALETNLLGGYARLVASSDEEAWRQAMLTQVGPVQAVGGRLGIWPGWFA